jgi:phosphoribosyl-AMP cyclohydrolase / phosphoribosyl-ATP pyrophosphohydrolase
MTFEWIDSVAFNQDGLVPVVVTEAMSGQLLMLAYASREALERTATTKQAWFFSRSRKNLWRKGETSGNTMQVTSITLDCDSDAVRYQVIPAGPACHTGAFSCFHNTVEGKVELGLAPLEELDRVIAQRKRDMPEGSYVSKLLADGTAKMARKVAEESTEVVLAALTETPLRLVSETADLFFHAMVLLESAGLSLKDVAEELAHRRKNG